MQPRQLAASAAARLCDGLSGPTELGYGGARGGGKSHWLLAQMGGDDCQRVPGLKCLLLRKVGKANLENLDDLRRRIFARTKHNWAHHKGMLSFPNGSRIIAGHFQKESDIDAYLGLEYDVIGVEEATTLSSKKYSDIRTCCRTSKPSWRPRMYSSANPGGVGHGWYKARFILPHRACTEGDTRFIPAKAVDNAYLNAEYRKVLEALAGWQKRAWCDGDWDIAAGQFFTTFRRHVHGIPHFDPAKAVTWFGSFDYGFTHYTAVLLGAKDGDGNLYIVDEYAQRMRHPVSNAEGIKRMLARHELNPGRLARFVAGADCWSKDKDGTTTAGAYADLGIRMTRANTDRIAGWAEVLRLLGDPESSIPPRLFIHERCNRLLESLPEMQHDPNHPEDVLKVDCDDEGVGGDDLPDALRYLVYYKPRVVKSTKLRGL